MFFDIFKKLCNERGVSCSRAAIEMGFSNSIATKWKKTAATPDTQTLATVSKYFNVPISYLLGDTDSPSDKSKTHWAEVVYIGDSSYTETSSKKGKYCEKLSRIVELLDADELKRLVDIATIMFENRE